MKLSQIGVSFQIFQQYYLKENRSAFYTYFLHPIFVSIILNKYYTEYK